MSLKIKEKGVETRLGTIFGEIIFHINTIEKHSGNITPDEYANSMLYQDAIFMRLQAIGERLKIITGKTLEDDPFGIINAFPEIHWREIKGMRKFFAHEYSSINISDPWDVVVLDLPKIKSAITDICNHYPTIKLSSEISYNAIVFRMSKTREEFMDSFKEIEEESEDDADRDPGY